MRNTPLRAFASPLKDSGKVRTDSTVTYDPITLNVDSTPVGQEKVKAGGYGWGEAIKSGTEPASMWKSQRDKIATEKQLEIDKEKSRTSKPGSGGQRMIMPE